MIPPTLLCNDLTCIAYTYPWRTTNAHSNTSIACTSMKHNQFIHTHTHTNTHTPSEMKHYVYGITMCVCVSIRHMNILNPYYQSQTILFICMYVWMYLELAGFPYSHRSIPACRQILNQREKCPTMFVNVDYIHVHNHADTVIDIVLIQLGNVDLP